MSGFRINSVNSLQQLREVRESLIAGGAVEVFSDEEAEAALSEGKVPFQDCAEIDGELPAFSELPGLLESRHVGLPKHPDPSGLTELPETTTEEIRGISVTVKWERSDQVREKVEQDMREFFGHVPEYGPLSWWKAEIVECPGISVVTGYRTEMRQYQWAPWMVIAGLPDGVQEEVEAQLFVRIRGVHLDETLDCRNLEELRDTVHRRAVEIIEENRTRRERETAEIAEIRASRPPCETEPGRIITLDDSFEFNTRDLVAFEGLPEDDRSQWGSRIILTYDEPHSSWCGAFMAMQSRDELVEVIGSNERDITPPDRAVKKSMEARMEDEFLRKHGEVAAQDNAK